ncbi:sensor histidine kinase [Lentibacillus sp. JNUCC-1]|uniref:sensor histidine kinase n=1 Tax=Lentibacillus sp. JNUCC-1 TaxID=2654513 RepID=UPI0018D23DDD|nr:histidine kinase [Lentibacillus sp. JNUCC-1]
MICVLAPLIGAFTILFLFIFEEKMEALKNESRQLALKEELQRNKFEILSQKIQPHFFFNTLNSIIGLARLDRKPELIHALETLSRFLKRKYITNQSLASIDEELTYTSYYLEIQKMRFGKRLEVTQAVDSSVKPMLIPTYVLQTLVENTFKHEFERYPGPALINIHIFAEANLVHMKIWNSKSAHRERLDHERDANSRTGMGLKNIKQRLGILFPNGDPQVHFLSDSEGTTVHVTWPIQYEAPKGGF